MTSAVQSELRLPRTHRTVLADISIAMDTLQYDVSTVMEMFWGGDLLWTWDVAPQPDRCRAEWRFWARELIAPSSTRQFKIDDVVEMVVGHETCAELSVHTTGQTLLLRRNSVHRLIETGQLAGRISKHVGWVQRASLVAWLKSRWTGNLKPR